MNQLIRINEIIDVISISLSNMTSAALAFPFFPLWKQTQHHRERRSVGHVSMGYRDSTLSYLKLGLDSLQKNWEFRVFAKQTLLKKGLL